MPPYIRPRLIVRDPDAAIDFYQRSLGARLDGSFVDRDITVNADLSIGLSSLGISGFMGAAR
jgi:catechol 2,3-dioxygenase-like lactoylglutathione lyase family enzyme